jgi:hypothetical protein
MKWITIEMCTADSFKDHYVYCDDDFYVLHENDNEEVITRLILSKFLNHTITIDDAFEGKTGWYWFGKAIYTARIYQDITKEQLVTVTNFVHAKKLSD